MATRKPRCDSAAAALRAAQNAAKGDLEPPDFVQLSADAKPYFAIVVRARARDEWNELDLTVAAQLAECLADSAQEHDSLLAEGRVITNDKGTPIANPRMSVVEQLARKQMALMRTLQMGGRVAGTAGDKRKKQGARKLEQDARQAREEAEEEDGLLA